NFYVAIIGNYDVLRRNIAMNDIQRLARFRIAPLVGVLKTFEDFNNDADGDADRQHLLFGETLFDDGAQIFAVDVLHGNEVVHANAAKIENLHDVGVRKFHGDLRLIDEHADEVFVFGKVREDLLDHQQTLEALHT